MDEGPGEVEARRGWGVSRHQLGRPARNKAYQRKLVEEPWGPLYILAAQ